VESSAIGNVSVKTNTVWQVQVADSAIYLYLDVAGALDLGALGVEINWAEMSLGPISVNGSSPMTLFFLFLFSFNSGPAQPISFFLFSFFGPHPPFDPVFSIFFFFFWSVRVLPIPSLPSFVSFSFHFFLLAPMLPFFLFLFSAQPSFSSSWFLSLQWRSLMAARSDAATARLGSGRDNDADNS
jgi:hypothetical protein